MSKNNSYKINFDELEADIKKLHTITKQLQQIIKKSSNNHKMEREGNLSESVHISLQKIQNHAKETVSLLENVTLFYETIKENYKELDNQLAEESKGES